MLIAQALRKRYQKREVVRDFSLRLSPGEVVGLLGPNGAGKTTCFYMIVGLVATDGGKITLDAQDITGMPMHSRARLGVGYLPQEASVFRRLSVADNILAILELRADLKMEQRQRELDALLDELQIGRTAGRVADRSYQRATRRQPVGRRATPRRNCPSTRGKTAFHAVGRAFCRCRSNLGWRNPEDRPPSEGTRYWRSDHRSQRPRDAGYL